LEVFAINVWIHGHMYQGGAANASWTYNPQVPGFKIYVNYYFSSLSFSYLKLFKFKHIQTENP